MRVAFSGSHGVGKTTLLNEIKPLHRIEEVARSVIERLGNPIHMDINQRCGFQEYVLYKQIAREIVSDSFFSDRSLLDILAYSEDLPIYDALYAQVDSYLKKYPYDVVFYIPIEFHMEKDGVRPDDEQYRVLIDSRIKHLAQVLGIDLVLLKGTVKERSLYVNQWLSGVVRCL